MTVVCVGNELCVDGAGRLRSPQSISTGWVTSGWYSYGQGWGASNLETQAIRIGQMVSVRLTARRTDPEIVPPASQNIPDEIVAQITDPRFRPAVNWFLTANSNAHLGGAGIDTLGVLRLFTLSSTLGKGSDLVFTTTYVGSDEGFDNPCAV